MDSYLSDLRSRYEGETEQIYRDQLVYYDEFIRSLIQTNTILTRHFYIVVPYTASGKTDFELVKEQLGLTVDIVEKGMMRLGMHARHLTSLEALDLFYSFYNPAQAKIQPLTERALSLIHTALTKGEQL
jgi:hypothetical protein